MSSNEIVAEGIELLNAAKAAMHEAERERLAHLVWNYLRDHDLRPEALGISRGNLRELSHGSKIRRARTLVSIVATCASRRQFDERLAELRLLVSSEQVTLDEAETTQAELAAYESQWNDGVRITPPSTTRVTSPKPVKAGL